MPKKKAEFSPEQIQFLALLAAAGGAVSIDVAGALAPLPPGPLLDLIQKGKEGQWLAADDAHCFTVSDALPSQLERAIEKINTPGNLARLIEKMYALRLSDQIGAVQMLSLLNTAGRNLEAAEYEVRLAYERFNANDPEGARHFLQAAAERLYPSCPDDRLNRLYLESVLALSNLSFSLGYGLGDIERHLARGGDVAETQGDRRSRALINLHLGRLYYFTARRDEALTALSMGFEEIQTLGDDDISGRSAVFLGLFYFIKGLHREAVAYFEKAEQVHAGASLGVMTHPMAPYMTGYCACYLGHFHQAIGNLDYHWRMARDRKDLALGATIRAVLGTVLVLVGKKSEGLFHLEQTIEEAQLHKSAFGEYLALGGLALHHFLAGRLDEAYRISKKIIQVGERGGFVRQYASPWVLEFHYEFHRLGFEPLPGVDFEATLAQTLNGVNVHLQGVAFRLNAREQSAQGEDHRRIAGDLSESRRCLEAAGDPVQISKTILEMARLKLREGRRDRAAQLAREALHLLGGYAAEFFPDEFRPLIDDRGESTSPAFQRSEYLQRYLEMIESLYPIESRQEVLAKVLMQTNRLFGAERSALFWFPEGRHTARPEVRATCNLSASEVRADAFKPNMKLVFKAFQSNLPRMSKSSVDKSSNPTNQVRSVLCIPVEVGGAVQGVLYFDNSYLPDAFEFLDPETMRHIVRHTNIVVERRLNHLKVEEERNLLASMTTAPEADAEDEIIAQSREMIGLIQQADHVAATRSTVLILGETGTGKELLARRIHHQSGRARKPFIVVDSTTIPEHLLESELFGHERGAFTGADQRKIGRIELAHEGTLFLDEIGELPPAAQAKLLRALQERSFNRVGGTAVIHADFRLVAATNRDLEKEVAAGRFREDLFYRLNVIPLELPPLRDRADDIPLLAERFLSQYAARHHHRHLVLSPAQKEALSRYAWPGNIRELKNLIERAVLLSQGESLSIVLPEALPGKDFQSFADLPSLDELQRRYIGYVINKTNGRVGGPGGAAEILGMNRTSLYSRMRQLKIDPKALRKGADSDSS